MAPTSMAPAAATQPPLKRTAAPLLPAEGEGEADAPELEGALVVMSREVRLSEGVAELPGVVMAREVRLPVELADAALEAEPEAAEPELVELPVFVAEAPEDVWLPGMAAVLEPVTELEVGLAEMAKGGDLA